MVILVVLAVELSFIQEEVLLPFVVEEVLVDVQEKVELEEEFQ